jgi:protein-disulfide isomerase
MNLKTPVGSDDHAQGPADAPVTLVEYGDYQCPYCGQAYPIVKAIQTRFGSRLRFVFRNMPLKNAHPQAELAAEAAEAAALQGKFWQMHDLLYEHQGELGAEFVVKAATRLHLDVGAFEKAIETGQVRPRVEHDFMDGVHSGVNGTPTFFINGTRFDDSWDPETLGAAIERAITGGAPAASPSPRPIKHTRR